MAAKAPGGKKRPRRKRKLRLSLRQSKIKKTDSYTDSLGWSTDVGRTLEEAPKKAEPEIPNSMRYVRMPSENTKTKTFSIYSDLLIS